MSNNNDSPPFGGIFAGLGAIVGMGYGFAITQHFLGAVGGFFVGSLLGYIFEHILFRVILIALFILMIVTRQALFDALFNDAHLYRQQTSQQVAIYETATRPEQLS